jgi:hypothetical protein
MSRLKSLFTDPEKRPRLVVWLGIAVIAILFFTVVSVGGTSTNWFCTQPCHIVHDDNTAAFNEGTHVMISCIACHEPVNASPLTFILMKIEVAPDIIPTVFKTFHMPLNPGSAIALEMTDEYCTQCHSMDTRVVSPSAGIIMDHDVHAAEGVTCTSCHNRVAHPEENITLVLEGNEKHDNWMLMDACFRCHGLEPGAQAPGKCSACHSEGFDLVPASHDAEGWYHEFGESGGHAAAYAEEASRVAEAEARAAEMEELEHRAAPEMPEFGTVNTCYTCHTKQYCTDCHGGVEMPHPDGFVDDHGTLGNERSDACASCHARSEAEAAGLEFCNACHHPDSDPEAPWFEQHDDAAKASGGTDCIECHDPRYCESCHVGGREGHERYKREAAGQ